MRNRMDLDKAPFRLDRSLPAERVGIEMVNAFSHLADIAEPASNVFMTLMDRLAIPADHPLVHAGRLLAGDIDAGGGGGHANPYHNRRHLCEVMLCSYYISLLQGFGPEACAEVVLSALMHDYAHDGQRNGEIAFRLERQSVTTAMALFADVALTAAAKNRIAAAVLATEFMHGQAFAMACHVAHERALHAQEDTKVQDAIPEVPALAPELAVLASDPQAARQALVLCEADVLPSVGLTFSHALKMQAELSAEWDTALDVHDKLRFIDEWLKRTLLSLFFKPNVDVVQRLLLLSLSKATS